MNASKLPLSIRAVGRRHQPARTRLGLGLGLGLALGLTACAEAGSEPDLDPSAYPPVVIPDAGANGGGATTGGSALPPNLSGGGTMGGWLANAGGTTGTAGGTGLTGGTAGTGSTAGGSVGAITGGGTLSGTLAGTAGGIAGTTGGIGGGFTAGGTLAGLGGGTSGTSPIGGLLGGTGLIGGGAGGGTTGGGTGTPLDPSVKKPDASKLPKVSGTCPDLSRNGTVSVAGSGVQLWVGTKPGPVYFYFHGTGSAPGEVDQALPGVTAGVRNNGGIVASWDTSNEKGESTGSVWTVWFTGDFDAADQILACGIEKGIVDTGRIHVSGYSAGGLQAGAMLFMRSNYLASGIVYSGGKGFGAGALQDRSNVPAVLGSHGAQGSDWLILDFSDGTKGVEQELKKAGGFAIDCDDGGSHVDFALGRAGLSGKATQFLIDHPYNTKPSPYAAGLPAGFPKNCTIQ